MTIKFTADTSGPKPQHLVDREVHQDPGRPTRALPGMPTVPHTGLLECMAYNYELTDSMSFNDSPEALLMAAQQQQQVKRVHCSYFLFLNAV